MSVVTRFAPSPTGLLHAGNYRTAVFSYLYAKKHGGKTILRIEDTDAERSKKEYEDNIREALDWLSLQFDAFYRQSERRDIHTAYLKKLVDSGMAYVSDESGKEGATRSSVIRFKNPNEEVTFHDLIRGDVTMNTSDLGDFVIAKSMEEPLFHLAVVVDDHEMGITHVIRGEDHISNTPRQMLIQRAIGARTPDYAHLPLVLAPDRSKLSKRKGAHPLTWYRDQGYLPEAVLNYMALLGWNPGTPQEVFTVSELIEAFDLTRVQKSGASFDAEKLLWLNKEHLNTLSSQEFFSRVKAYYPEGLSPLPYFSDARWEVVLPVLRERLQTLSELKTLHEAGDLHYYFEDPVVEASKLVWKDSNQEETRAHLSHVLETLKNAQNWSSEGLKAALWDYATLKGRGAVLWPFRYALSGKEKSPDPFTLAAVLGKEVTLSRLSQALATIGE